MCFPLTGNVLAVFIFFCWGVYVCVYFVKKLFMCLLCEETF